MDGATHDATYKPDPKAIGFCVLLMIIGAICFGVGYQTNPGEALSNWLIGAFYTTMLALFGMFFIAMNYAAGAGWHVVLRRVPEAMTAYLVIGGIAMAGLLIAVVKLQGQDGVDHIYEWLRLGDAHGHGHEAAAHGHGMEHAAPLTKEDALHQQHEALLDGKSAYLNLQFFAIRMVAYFAIWMFFAWLIIRNSRKQDVDGDVKHTKTNVRLSCLFIVLFAVTICLAAFDWIMSLQPTWFSTIFGVYNFAGTFSSGIATIIVLLVVLRKMGYFKEVNANHFHNLGQWLIVTCTFWAYIWFSQLLLIWYANIPEETQYYVFRMNDPNWDMLFYINVIWNFGVPFLLLLQQPVKRNEKLLCLVALWVLAGRWIDLWFNVGPPANGFDEHAHAYGFSVTAAAGTTIGFIGLFGLVVLLALKRAPLLPKKDPYFEESVHHQSA